MSIAEAPVIEVAVTPIEDQAAVVAAEAVLASNDQVVEAPVPFVVGAAVERPIVARPNRLRRRLSAATGAAAGMLLAAACSAGGVAHGGTATAVPLPAKVSTIDLSRCIAGPDTSGDSTYAEDNGTIDLACLERTFPLEVPEKVKKALPSVVELNWSDSQGQWYSSSGFVAGKDQIYTAGHDFPIGNPDCTNGTVETTSGPLLMQSVEDGYYNAPDPTTMSQYNPDFAEVTPDDPANTFNVPGIPIDANSETTLKTGTPLQILSEQAPANASEGPLRDPSKADPTDIIDAMYVSKDSNDPDVAIVLTGIGSPTGDATSIIEGASGSGAINMNTGQAEGVVDQGLMMRDPNVNIAAPTTTADFQSLTGYKVTYNGSPSDQIYYAKVQLLPDTVTSSLQTTVPADCLQTDPIG